MIEEFSGADLQAILSDAQFAAIHECLSSANSNEPGKMPAITDTVLKSIASKARRQLRFKIFSLKQQLLHLASSFLMNLIPWNLGNKISTWWEEDVELELSSVWHR
ncbi:hypothetical protein Godav_022124 [Gossypium davidsonii]|uniref:AAA ATPase AAA+ lid domain-containing protein n=1 Tax=Gossypium davidsonii TaxID=34287 RepID=A0A7J8TI11_GOSDV|nr:hypothetical protein [Gossypium davidsonii]